MKINPDANAGLGPSKYPTASFLPIWTSRQKEKLEIYEARATNPEKLSISKHGIIKSGKCNGLGRFSEQVK